eukprot:scaffold6162_cov154-Cylindrotheca_fusiformis.AAC.1
MDSGWWDSRCADAARGKQWNNLMLSRSRRRSTVAAFRKKRRRARPARGGDKEGTRTEAIPSLTNPAYQSALAASGQSSSSPCVLKSSTVESHQGQIKTQQQEGLATTSGNNPFTPTSSLPSQIAETSERSISSIPPNEGIQNSMTNGEPKHDTACWGMSLEKKSSENEDNNERSKEVIEATVKSVKDGILDMYAYHRGREGMEPRDAETGELLSAQIATDTNHVVESPKLAATIIVEFPLEDETDTKDKRNSKATPSHEVDDEDVAIEKAMHRESFSWDLGDPNTPSPLSFATSIADEYGLSFGQMVDVASSIQEQIDAHLHQNFSYSPAIALRDPLGNDRRFSGPVRHTHRFDQVIRVREGGTRFVKQRAQRLAERLPRPKSSGSITGSTGGGRGRRREERQYETIYVDDNEEIEEKYCEEVKARSKLASQRAIATLCANGSVGLLERKIDFHCHICHKRANITYNFACGVVSHAYCEMHCKASCSEVAYLSQPPMRSSHSPSCFIESIGCFLRARLSGLLGFLSTRDFKRHCEEQGKEVSEAVFDDVLEKCQGASSTRSVVKIVKVSKRRVEEPLPTTRAAGKTTTKPRESSEKTGPTKEEGLGIRQRHAAPKPPLVDFPREVCGLVELNPGTPDDYMRVYTGDGSFSVSTYPEAWTLHEEKNPVEQGEKGRQKEMKNMTDGEKVSSGTPDRGFAPSAEAEVAEDGNVDYCHVCQTAGNLLCCDYCPRAFHPHCLKSKAASDDGEDVWRCEVCDRESEGLEDDLIDGKGSLDGVRSTFRGLEKSSEALKAVQILSIIHEMLQKLIAYDFGFMFQEPVEGVKGYKDIVKHPMDLGTISSKLMDGSYLIALKQGSSFDDVIVAVLNDIELVWHNCLLFNSVDSAIYRMAGVHRRRAASIRSKSFDHLLSSSVKATVGEYAMSCERKRRKLQVSAPSAEDQVLRSKRPKGKYKIGVKSSKSGSRKAVAILDPSSGRIVKMFSSVKNASQAVELLQKLGHPCEWTMPDSKSIINRSSADPSLLLFGYRWLPLEDLRARKVKFPKPSSAFIEMRYGSVSRAFVSIEEALSSPALPMDADMEEVRNKLRSVPEGTEWVDLFGISWRRPLVNGSCNEENPMKNHTPVDEDARLLRHSVAVKEDLVTARNLVGFGSIQAAYDDWKQTVTCSPTFPDSEDKHMDAFKQYYLDGDRNVDGLVWRSTQAILEQKARNGLAETIQKNDNNNLHPEQKELSNKGRPDIGPRQKGGDEALSPEANSIEVIQNSQQNASEMEVEGQYSKINPTVPLGNRKRPLTEVESNQWGVPWGGSPVNGVESPRRQKTVA